MVSRQEAGWFALALLLAWAITAVVVGVICRADDGSTMRAPYAHAWRALP